MTGGGLTIVCLPADREDARALEPVLRLLRERGHSVDVLQPPGDRWHGMRAPVRRRVDRTGRRRARAALLAVDRALPPPVPARRSGPRPPDVLVLTPRSAGSVRPADHIRWAREHGAPTVVAATRSSDLVHGPLLLDQPDLVVVWNELQARAARERHGVRAGAVQVTGAARYDDRFDGLVPARGTRRCVLYVCAPPAAGRNEAFCLERWVKRLREEPVLDRVPIAVRPSPDANVAERALVRSTAVRLAGVDLIAEDDYPEALATSAAVVAGDAGTVIEAAIAGRVAYAIDSAEMRTADGHPAPGGGGPLRIANTWWAHADELIAAVDAEGRQQRDFGTLLGTFVRPGGLGSPVAPVTATAVERLAATEPVPESPSLVRRVTRRTLPAAASLARILVRLRVGLRRLLLRPERSTVRQSVAPAARAGARTLMRHAGTRVLLTSTRLPARGVRKRVRRMADARQATGAMPARTASLEAVRATVAAIAHSEGPVVAGAWHGDVALELLLWRPFLCWIADQYPDLASRLLVVSRGRVAHWYANVSGGYVDLADLFDYPPDNVSQHAAAVELRKTPGALEDDQLNVAVRDAILGGHAGALLSPSLLFEAYVERAKGSLSLLRPILAHRPLPAAPTPSPVELPARSYTVAAFPFAGLFTDTGDNRDAAAAVIHSVAAQRSVVVVGAERLDLPAQVTAAAVLLPAVGAGTSLAEFQALVASSHSFVGSWSGLAHLASAAGVPVRALYSNEEARRRAWFLPLQQTPREPAWGPFEIREASAAAAAAPSLVSVGTA